MDYVIGGLIVAALIGAYKLIKDFWDKKQTKIGWLIIETTLICSALVLGIGGRLKQNEGDRQKGDTLNVIPKLIRGEGDKSRQQGDSNTQVILDLAKAAEKRSNEQLEKFEMERKSYEAERAVDRKPRIEIRTVHKFPNPEVIERVKDSFYIYTDLENFGSTYADEVVVTTYLGKRTADAATGPLTNPMQVSKVSKRLSLSPGDRWLLRTDFWMNDKFLPEEDFYFGIYFSYKDSLLRAYDQFELFRWNRKTLVKTQPFMASDDEDSIFIKVMKYNKFWRN